MEKHEVRKSMEAIEELAKNPAPVVEEQDTTGEDKLVQAISEWIHLDVDPKAIKAVLWAIWMGELEGSVAQFAKRARTEYAQEREEIDGPDAVEETAVEEEVVEEKKDEEPKA